MTKKRIICALIGLSGAVNNNGKTENTDSVVRAALLSDDADEAVRSIHREKFVISPNCETCRFPCGNTSDYEMERFAQAPESIRKLKDEIICELVRLAAVKLLPDIVYKAISYLGYDMAEETYTDLLKELRT